MSDKPSAPPQAELQSVRSEKFVKLYSNSAQLEVTPWDFTIVFGEIKRPPSGSPQIEQQIAVVMSPQHAKALLGILAGNLQEYEKQVGEIRLPQPGVATPEKPKTPVPLGFKTQ